MVYTPTLSARCIPTQASQHACYSPSIEAEEDGTRDESDTRDEGGTRDEGDTRDEGAVVNPSSEIAEITDGQRDVSDAEEVTNIETHISLREDVAEEKLVALGERNLCDAAS